MRRKFHSIRRISTTLLLTVFIGLPFLRIGGQSALRFDVGTLRLYFFGAVLPMSEFFIVLVAGIFLTFFTIFGTMVFGRLWCGWFCPQTVLLDAVSFLAPRAKKTATAIVSIVVRVVLSSLLSAVTIVYFVSPSQILFLLSRGGIPAHVVFGSWLCVNLLLYLDISVLGRTFCATVCPYAKLQTVLFDDRTLLVAFNRNRASECMACNACVKACPVHIDIRKGSQMDCIHCAECVDVCTERMASRKKKSLIGYSFGDPGSEKKSTRLAPLLTGGLAFLFLMFFVYLSATRMPFDLNIRFTFSPGFMATQKGEIANQYELSFVNREPEDIVLTLKVQSNDGEAAIVPDTVTISKETTTRIPAVLTVKNLTGSMQTTRVTLFASSARYNKILTKQIYIIHQQ